MPSQNMPAQRLKLASLPLGLHCSGFVTHTGKNLTTGKGHKKKEVGCSSYWRQITEEDSNNFEATCSGPPQGIRMRS
jgi:hypothetical protein